MPRMSRISTAPAHNGSESPRFSVFKLKSSPHITAVRGSTTGATYACEQMAMQPAAVCSAPQWLRGLLSEEFFDVCVAHPGERKNDKNHFCVDCAAALCRHCLPHEHVQHDVLQVPPAPPVSFLSTPSASNKLVSNSSLYLTVCVMEPKDLEVCVVLRRPHR